MTAMKTLRLAAVLLALPFAGCVDEMARFVDDARVTARIGVMADTEVEWITGTKKLEAAFWFYRQSKVDAVVIAGKVTKDGYKDQREVLDKVWKRVFGGTETRLIVTEGRHEVKGFAFAAVSAQPLGICEIPTFYGGAKRALTDELGYYPRDSKAICAGSMSGVRVQSGFADAEGLNRRLASVAQGLLVSVYADRVSARRLNFSTPSRNAPVAEDVAEPWEIGVEAERDPAPQFWDDTRVLVTVGQDRTNRIYTVKWPNVQKRFTGARARSYEVEVVDPERKKRAYLRKSVLSEGFHLHETRDVAGVRCVFLDHELARCGDSPRIVFAVTPIGFFGKHGRTVYSEPVPLPSR